MLFQKDLVLLNYQRQDLRVSRENHNYIINVFITQTAKIDDVTVD